MRKPLAALASASLALGVLVGTSVAAPPPAEAAPYCGITWGSQDKYTPWPHPEPWTSTNVMKDVRAGRHDCFDRFVVDINGRGSWYNVGYQTVSDANAHAIPLRGAADLRIFSTSASVAPNGELAWDPGNVRELVDVTGYRTFRQAVLADYGSEDGHGEFGIESWTTIGLGVRAHLPFRVFLLDGPGKGSRLVVDVAHRW